MADKDSASRLKDNLQGEVDGASLYRCPRAAGGTDPHLSEVYRRLAAVEEAHAEFWRKQLGRTGAMVGRLKPGWRTRILAWLARRFGPQFVLPTISGLEKRDSRQYDNQPDAVAGGLASAERSHNRIVQAVVAVPPGGNFRWRARPPRGPPPRWRQCACARRCSAPMTGWSPISAWSWAWPAPRRREHTILLTGLAGLVAGACSMAMGEWLSVTSSRELNQRQIAIEADELARDARGGEGGAGPDLPGQGAGARRRRARWPSGCMANKETALDTLVREELGIDPTELGGSPWTAAASSFGLFAVGAIFPVAPFFWLSACRPCWPAWPRAAWR